MGEGIVRLFGVAECAFVDDTDVPLFDQRLVVVRLGDSWRECVRAVVAGHAHDAAVPTRLPEELARLLKLKAGAGMAVSAPRLIDPRPAHRVADGLHRCVAGVAVHPVGKMNVPMTLGSDAGVARVALIVEFQDADPIGMR